MRKLLTILGILFLISTALALNVSVQEEFELFDNDYLEIEIENTTNTTQPLNINFYTPTKHIIHAPETVGPGKTITAKIKINHEFEKYTEINSKLEIFLGTEYEEKNITLKFYKPQKNNLTGLFSLGIIPTTAFETGIIFTMLIIIAILLIALFAKIKEDKK